MSTKRSVSTSLPTLGPTYHLKVNRDQSLDAMVEAGRYDYANRDITADHFPPTGSGTTEEEAVLVPFDRFISTETGLAELDRLGLRPGGIAELLAFGEQHPEVQRQFPIIELASVWSDRFGLRLAAYLHGDAFERRLLLYWCGYVWFASYRFLAFRKS